MLKGIRIRKIDGMLLMRVFCYIGEVKTKSLAESTELDFSVVFETKFEGMLGDLLI